MMDIEEFDFEIEHRPDAKHGITYAMSRKPCRECVFCKKDIAGMPSADQQIDCGVACSMFRLDLDACSANQLAK